MRIERRHWNQTANYKKTPEDFTKNGIVENSLRATIRQGKVLFVDEAQDLSRFRTRYSAIDVATA